MLSPSEKDKALLATPDTAHYNFHHEYSVVLDRPVSEVYPILAHGDKMERVIRLSALCTYFELFDSDVVVSPDSAPLAESRVRTEPASSEGGGGLPRQYFRLQETIPLVFGLTHKKVEIVGAQTWDENAKVALYESVTDQGIMVWKLRTFKEIEDDGKKKTSVIETIKGSCPTWMKFIVQRETMKGHRYVDCSARLFVCDVLHFCCWTAHTWRNTTLCFDA